MKIDTELVKNKRFLCQINSSDIKRAQEYRVLATLRYLFPEEFIKMITDEAPDLQDCENGRGIEVTSAVKESDMKVSRAFSELYQGIQENIEHNKEIIVSNGYSFINITNDKVALSSMGTADGEKCFFQQSIQRKIKKLPRYREKFKEIGLAIILPEIPTSYAEEHFCEWISEILGNATEKFDFVYVISHRFCIYYNVQDCLSMKYKITSEESRLITTLARMTAEKELSLGDVEWM